MGSAAKLLLRSFWHAGRDSTVQASQIDYSGDQMQQKGQWNTPGQGLAKRATTSRVLIGINVSAGLLDTLGASLQKGSVDA